MKNRIFSIVILLCGLVVLAACQTTPAEPKVQLTVDEVRATFIDRDWGTKPTTTHYNFMSNRQWAYKEPTVQVFGTYDIAQDGVLCAVNANDSKWPDLRTCYTFYKQGEKYVYHHDRWDKFLPIFLR